MFGNFFLNGKHVSFRFIADFDVGGYGRGTGADGDMLTFFDNIHKGVIISLKCSNPDSAPGR